MTHIVTRARKAGGSLILTIPRDVRKSMGIKEDQLVEVDLRSSKVDFFGAIPKVNSYRQNAD